MSQLKMDQAPRQLVLVNRAHYPDCKLDTGAEVTTIGKTHLGKKNRKTLEDLGCATKELSRVA